MKLKSLLISSLMLLSAGSAWADIEINETNFPDENFRNWLSSQTYGSDGVLTDEEIAGVSEINVDSKGIQNLKGIEYFTALTKLSCQRNSLASFDISKNTLLTYLHCYSNGMTSLDVTNNTALTELDCKRNGLTSLDVTKNTALKVLNCSNNRLTLLDVTKNTALTELDYNYNQLTSIDVSKNTELTWLSSSHNQLTSLDVSKNTKLQHLGCSANELTSLDVSNTSKLNLIECYENQIKGEGMDAFVASLPVVTNSKINIIYDRNEQNVMTIAQVAAAKAKGWIPCYRGESIDGTSWHPYEGVDPATAIAGVETDEASDSAPWFTLGGAQLDNAPTAAGIYIHNGKKVLVK